MVENGRIKFTPEHQRIYDELKQKYALSDKTHLDCQGDTCEKNEYKMPPETEQDRKWREYIEKKYGSRERYLDIQKKRDAVKLKIVHIVATILPFILYAAYIIWLTTSYHGESTIEYIFGGNSNFLSVAFEIIFYIVCCIFAAALTYFMSFFVASCCAVLFDIEFPDGDYMINILPYIVLIGAIVPAIVSFWF